LTYPTQPQTEREIRELAQKVVDRQNQNMVNDAIVLARWVLAHTAEDDARPLAPRTDLDP